MCYAPLQEFQQQDCQINMEKILGEEGARFWHCNKTLKRLKGHNAASKFWLENIAPSEMRAWYANCIRQINTDAGTSVRFHCTLTDLTNKLSHGKHFTTV